MLIEPPVLVYPDWEKPFYIETDSSDYAVGGTLAQREVSTGKLRPLGYFSNVLQPAERNYSAGEKECWAVIAGSRKWKTYCRAASKLYFVTDHQPLEWLRKRKDPRGKYARWILELESLNYEIVSRNGMEHVVPDCLSRVCNAENDAKIIEHEMLEDSKILSINDTEKFYQTLKREQLGDDAISFAILQLQENNKISKGRFKRFNRMHLHNGILKRGDQIVVPCSMRNEVVQTIHNSSGHPGIDRTLEMIARKYSWVGMQEYIHDFCTHCKICLENKASREAKAPLSEFVDPPSKPCQQIAFDVATLPWSSNQHRYFLLMIDMYSRYIELRAMKDQEGPTIKQAILQQWIYRHGKFQVALSDQAKNVDGNTIQELCKQLNIEKKHSSPYHPEGDGMAERAIGTVKTMMRCVLQEENVSKYNWPDVLQQVAFLFNASKCCSTGLTPHEVMYGVKPELPLTIMQNSNDKTTPVRKPEYVQELKAKLEKTWSEVGEKI